MPGSPADRLPPTKRPGCGTRSGYSQHSRAGERACEPCSAAAREAQRRRRATPEGRAFHRQSSREAQHRRRSTPEGRESHNGDARRRNRTPDGLLARRAATERTFARLRARTTAEADADFQRTRPRGKACRGCGELLPAEAFARKALSIDGRQPYCIENGCRYRHWKLKRDKRLHEHWRAKGIDPEVCVYCQAAPAEDLEHVMPKALGGSDDFDNLAPACPSCNRGVGGKFDIDPVTWLAARFPERLGAIVALFPHIAQEVPA